MRSADYTEEIRKLLENTLGIPCFTKENHPCELMFHPAAVGYPYAKQLRLCVTSSHICPRVLLTVRHIDRFWGNYAVLCHICSNLQRVLDEEAPNCMIHITDDYYLQLTISSIVERTSDVTSMILQAFRLLRKYENAIREELRLQPEDEDEWEDEEYGDEDRRPFYTSPANYNRRLRRAPVADHSCDNDNDDNEGEDDDETVF